MIRDLSAAKHRSVRALTAQAASEGWTEETLALRLAEIVGVGERETRAAQRLREKLREEGLAKPRIAHQVNDYLARARMQRAQRIAANEMAEVMATAQRVVWAQQREDGAVSPYAVRITRTHRDDRLCAQCRRENGQRRSLKDVTGGTPFHIGCRCTEEIEDEGVVAHLMKGEPRDGDGDGWVYDGTPRMRPAAPKKPKKTKRPDVRAFVEAWKQMPRTNNGGAYYWYEREAPGEMVGRLYGGVSSGGVHEYRWNGHNYVVKKTGPDRAEKEEKAAEIARALGFDHDAVAFTDSIPQDDGEPDFMTTHVVMPKHEGKTSFQRYGDIHWGEMYDKKGWTGNMYPAVIEGSFLLAILDMLIGNYDRNSGNWIISDKGEIHPIDHEFSDILNEAWVDFAMNEDDDQEVKTDEIDFWFPVKGAWLYSGPTDEMWREQREKYWKGLIEKFEAFDFKTLTSSERVALTLKLQKIEEYMDAVEEAGGYNSWAYVGSENWPRGGN